MLDHDDDHVGRRETAGAMHVAGMIVLFLTLALFAIAATACSFNIAMSMAK
jgi:hypothetical protein